MDSPIEKTLAVKMVNSHVFTPLSLQITHTCESPST